jgi:hypothetical protein
MLENKLAWAPASIDTILAGGEPTETVVELHRSPRPNNSNALSQASTEESLLELRRRIIAPRDRHHNTWDDGLDPTATGPKRASRTSADPNTALASDG